MFGGDTYNTSLNEFVYVIAQAEWNLSIYKEITMKRHCKKRCQK